MKSHYERLEKTLLFEPKNAWESYPDSDIIKFADKYKKFITVSKTERFAFQEIRRLAKIEDFHKFQDNDPLTAGKKYYFENMNKAIALAIIGEKPISEGANIIVSHIDSPRLDLKQKPLYEDLQLALFRTHYYGGIKKWQWVNHPMALYGLVSAKNGDLQLIIGEDKEDPVFTVADLLPHLGQKQSEKPAKDVISAEELNILVGSIPVKSEKVKEKVKLAVLDHLHKKFGLTEEDLFSAEFCAVPAGEARDIGFDRSMVGAYGQDDKSCAFASLEALLRMKKPPEKTVIVFFMDKEEIGSYGATGSESMFFENIMRSISSDPIIALKNSKAISADVSSAVDPTYKDVYDLTNANFLGKGIIITKFTGWGGKFAGSDATAEYMRFVIDLCNKQKIPWQAGELGKVDEGGGGTVARCIARYGCDTVDVGIPLLSMHSPFEIISKADLYAVYIFYKNFLESK